MATTTLYQTAERWLGQVIGPNAAFRPGQWDAIESLIQDRGRVLVVQKTGWGKSMVYFLATRLLRDQDNGPTILISPLLALMRNQIDAANKLGLRATTINSTNRDDWSQIERDVLNGEIDLLLISPERLANERFQRDVWAKLKNKVGLMAVDEAHCISDWGHDFRPNYRRIMRILDDIPAGTPVLGTTATANDRVVKDVAEILGTDISILRGPLTRESLDLYICPKLSPPHRLVLLVKLLKRMQGSGIIYCATTNDCLVVANWLQNQGFKAKPYYSGVEDELGESRVALEQQLLNNEVMVLVASVALGMGFDKPDLHFVIHYQHPGSIIGYYQQIGRAGRGIDEAKIVLMHGDEDTEIQQYFIDSAFPKHEQVTELVRVLGESPDGLTRNEMQRFVNVRVGMLDKILLHLELENILHKENRHYRLTGTRTQPDYERWRRVTGQRQTELAQMKDYIAHDGCLMRFLATALDDPTRAEDCGRCQNCRGDDHRIRSNPTPQEIEAATRFLQEEHKIIFKPRKQWPSGASADFKGRIEETNALGIALCFSRDGGWGDYVAKGKRKGRFARELVEASAALLQEHWRGLSSPPTWITAVHSLRNPELVPHFAKQLAGALGLPYKVVIQQTKARPPQSDMQNSAQQFRNLLGTLKVDASLPEEPVLVVDDIVDSGWTLTLIGELLRRQGSGKVHPFTIAKRRG